MSSHHEVGRDAQIASSLTFVGLRWLWLLFEGFWEAPNSSLCTPSPELHLQHPATVPPEGSVALSDDITLLICSSLFHTDILALTSSAAEISLPLLRITALFIPHLTPNNYLLIQQGYRLIFSDTKSGSGGYKKQEQSTEDAWDNKQQQQQPTQEHIYKK